VSTSSQFERNPAALSAGLTGLFPAGVAVAELRDPGDPGLLSAAERYHVRQAVRKRVQEFAAGRLCARRALAEFRVENFDLHVAVDRQPLWPDGMLGSITHTAGLCAAVVAPRRTLAAVGMDSEIVGHVTADIWPAICGPQEADWLRSLPASERAAAVTLIFSAKEAFYKCQYPVTGEWLDFHDLVVEPAAWGRNPGELSIRATRPIAFAAHARMPMPGRYRYHEEFVSVGVALPRGCTLPAGAPGAASTPCRRETP